MAKYTFKELCSIDIFEAAKLISEMSRKERKFISESITDEEKLQIDTNAPKVNSYLREKSEYYKNRSEGAK